MQTSPSGSVQRLREGVENALGVKPHKRTITMLMEPGQRERLRVGFRPKDDLPRTSLILVRNNLTIIETMVLRGQGGRGEMRFSNKAVGSQLPLKFDMNERSHLKHCHSTIGLFPLLLYLPFSGFYLFCRLSVHFFYHDILNFGV